MSGLFQRCGEIFERCAKEVSAAVEEFEKEVGATGRHREEKMVGRPVRLMGFVVRDFAGRVEVLGREWRESFGAGRGDHAERGVLVQKGYLETIRYEERKRNARKG